MQCKTQKLLLVLSFLSMFMLTFSVEGSPYYITRPTYFPSKNGSYITFHSSLLPLTFNTLYKDGSTQRWHFNAYWLTTTSDMTVTVWFSTNWFNYTVTGGTQQIHNGTEPNAVYFDDVEQEQGTTWSYSGGTITVTPSGTDVAVFWGETEEPETPEPPANYTVAGGAYELTVYTSVNHLPCIANVTVKDWNTKTSDMYGKTVFHLPYGDYFVSATYGGERQNKTVGVYADVHIGFNFHSPLPHSLHKNAIIIMALIVVCVFVAFGYLVLKKG